MNICKWYNNSESPVIFMIDDLANVWVDSNNNGEIDIEEDWGYAGFSEKSSFKYLENNILKDFQNIKVTFFVPVGNRVGMIKNPNIKSVSKAINSSEKSKDFFKKINDCNRFEVAYHGTDHGKVGKTNTDFIQEWELFNSVEEANLKTKEGIDIYFDTLGENPLGGKYCGYISNEFSDKSIDELGFLWWCRFCNLDVEKAIKENRIEENFHGRDKNFITNNDIKFFGENKVIDIPTTVNGGLLTSIYNLSGNIIKRNLKKFFPHILINKKLKLIDNLLKNNLVISIQEHISPARDDGRRQTPNIYDDRLSLIKIFEYLNSKPVWFCTCSELAKYVYYRENLSILENENGFSLNLANIKFYNDFKISIIINEDKSCLVTPSGKVIKGIKGIFNIPIEEGDYIFKEEY